MGRSCRLQYILPVYVQGSGERARAVLTGEVEDVTCGMVISSIGYKSVPIDPSVPFDSSRAIIPNNMGRVQQAAGAVNTIRAALLCTRTDFSWTEQKKKKNNAVKPSFFQVYTVAAGWKQVPPGW